MWGGLLGWDCQPYAGTGDKYLSYVFQSITPSIYSVNIFITGNCYRAKKNEKEKKDSSRNKRDLKEGR